MTQPPMAPSMHHLGPHIGDLLLDGRYRLLTEVKGAIGRPRVLLGEKGFCRFCGASDPSVFRKDSHTFPEALGNKWVISRDECDTCNTKIFSRYDDAGERRWAVADVGRREG